MTVAEAGHQDPARAKLTTLAELSDHLAAQTAGLTGVYSVGVSGIDCAGKTTIRARLASHLRAQGHQVLELSTDDFHLPRGVRNANIDQAMGYYMDTVDFHTLIDEVLVPLRRDGALDKLVPQRDLLADRGVETRLTVQAPVVVLVDGIFLYRRDLADVFDYKIWMDLPFELSLSRGLVRDKPYYKSTGVIRHRYYERFLAGQRKHLDRDAPRERAHAILDGSQPV